MPQKAKPDDPDWIDLSPRQKRQIRAFLKRVRMDDRSPIPDGPTPPDAQMKALRAYHEGKGPHINFVNSFVAKVASEVFQKAARRKLN